MSQFVVFLMQGLLVAIGDEIDRFFSNNIGIDFIVAYSSFTMLSWFMRTLAHSGNYTYRLWRNRVKTCIFVSVVVSILTGMLTIMLADNIIGLFTLTQVQYRIFKEYLIVYSLGLPIIAIGDVLDTYALLNDKVKLLIIADIFYYVILIGLDITCIVVGLGASYIIGGTIIAYLVFVLILWLFSGVHSENDPFRMKDIPECIRHATNCLIDKLSGKLAVIYYSIIMSKLGTKVYAIHSVCYSVSVFGECFTNCYNTYLLVKLANFGKSKRFKGAMLIMNKFRWKLLIMFIISVFPMVFLLKGELAYSDCIGWVWLYCTNTISLLYYETYKAYLESMEASKYLRYGGVFGMLTRICFITVAYYFGFGLCVLSLACTVDFAVRAYVYYVGTKYVRRAIFD